MKKTNTNSAASFTLFIAILFSCFSGRQVQGQTLTLQPDGNTAKDAYISNYPQYVNNNYATYPNIMAQVWSAGSMYIYRSMLQFNLSMLPTNAVITSATLTLYGLNHSPLSRPNTAYLRRITQHWEENIVTWNNQPASTLSSPVSLAASTSATQDYNIDVRAHVQDMVQNPQKNFGWMLQLQSEELTYSRLVFASSDYSDPAKWPKLQITYTIPGAICGATDAAQNWEYTKSYSLTGDIIGESKTFSDYLGRTTQAQRKMISGGYPLLTQSLYDAYGRAMAQTLPAPILTQTELCYVPNFVTNAAGQPYSYNDMDVAAKVNSPDPVNASSPLGAYYSNSNTTEPYVPASAYPYTRVTYDDAFGGIITRSAAAGEYHKMGSGHEKTTYALSAQSELNYLYGTGNSWVVNIATMPDGATPAFGTYINPITLPATNCYANKTVSVDENGVETVSITNLEGKQLATCLSGQVNGTDQNLFDATYQLKRAAGDPGYIDIHLPEGHANDLVLDEVTAGTGVTYTITNLKTGTAADYSTATPNLGVAGCYRISYKSGGTAVPALTIKCKLNYYNFSINYYDKAGRLRVVVPPLGFDKTSPVNKAHTLLTVYNYNSLNWQITGYTPDAGRTESVYRNDGNIRFTQNALQFASNATKSLRRFSYVTYDKAGRVTETGEYDPTLAGSGTNYFFENYADRTANPGNTASVHYILEQAAADQGLKLDPARCNVLSSVVYDSPDANFISLTGLSATSYVQNFLIGKVSYTKNANKTTWYSYDEQGRMVWMVQQLANMPTAGSFAVKTINYKYDGSSNVSEVAYQKEVLAESFYHYYAYDGDNRLLTVNTSRDAGTSKQEQAAYTYYKHGPLKRVELANKLQGNDYVYTINGWLKSMNAPELDTRDPGKDGFANSPNHVPKDFFGFALDYFSGDYVRSGTNIQYTGDITVAGSSAGKQLFNGLCKGQRWKTDITAAGIAYPASQLMYTYLYDKKYQLSSANFGTVSAAGTINSGATQTELTFSPTDDYKLWGISYDLNGNIKALNRNGFATASLAMDQLTYNYTGTTNNLNNVTDATAAGSAYAASIDFKQGQTTGNYTYDALGELTSDVAGAKKYKYNPSGLVTDVTDLSNTPIASFKYDENGQRIYKKTPATGNETWYIRDASGNIISTYEATNGTGFAQTELSFYGSGRLGVYNFASDKYLYELNDMQGNTRATFSKASFNTLSTSYDGLSNSDYLMNYSSNIDNTVDQIGAAPLASDRVGPGGFGSSLVMPVKAGETVSTTIYYHYTGTATANAMLVGALVDAYGNYDGTTWHAQAVGPPTGSGWQQLTLTYNVVAPPAGTDTWQLFIYPWNNDASATVWFDDMSLSISGGTLVVPQRLNLTDYYPHGGIMPGRNVVKPYKYRYDYQGQFAEKDAETNLNAFDLRMYDGKLGRWMTIDPEDQYHSPYLAMGNNPFKVDPSGGSVLDIVGRDIATGKELYRIADGLAAETTQWVGFLSEVSITPTASSLLSTSTLLNLATTSTLRTASNGFTPNEHWIGPALVMLGDNVIETRAKFVGATKGTSIASKTLSKALPQTFTKMFGKKVGVQIAKKVGTNVLGRGLGRLVPVVGWGLTMYDATNWLMDNPGYADYNNVLKLGIESELQQ